MADKISTVVLKVDLECARCYKKIRKVLCKIQDRMNIKTISFDEKSNAVTVSGPFDAEKLCRKLCSEAGKVIRELHVKGKESKDGGGGEKPKAAKDAGKVEKDGGKAEKDGGKAEKAKDDGGKPEKADKKDGGDKPKDEKPEKKVKFVDAAPAADAKPGKAMPQLPPGMTKADLAPLLEKMMQAKQAGQGGGPQPPRGEPIMMVPPPAAAAQGVAVPSIWPAPAGAVSCYSYDPAGYGQPSYYGGGGCGRGCQCASCYKPAPPGGYYGVPVHDHQGWYNRQPYYQQQQQPYCSEDPNAGCSVM
ncbi:protein PYRICULARIA ORYZAE RESISTANCE 21-like [Lolium rigidum]|uniref:protein PYRICULARIA ORYZAE RESISTANCE 21-like n=1 Tax=Lolium rigidum TaxID=89674 RepID=UPI001F5D8AFC|nr:protein PYRICULARIA ORYZAE RESISTANCE 21-like [Lolium rigidum]